MFSTSCDLTLNEKTDLLLSVLFKEELDEPFVVSENNRQKKGKIYLPLTKSLENIDKYKLSIPFNCEIELREKDIVIKY